MIGTAITAVYSVVADENMVRIWAFLEQEMIQGKNLSSRELLRFQITQHLMDRLPSEIIHFEFHVKENALPPFEVENGGFWRYFQHGVSFSGQPRLVPAVDHFIQEWRVRTGQIVEE